MKLVFADCETTGLDPQRHALWDLALIVREQGLSDAEYQFFFKPDLALAEPVALQVGRYYERTCALKSAGSREKVPKWSDPAKTAPGIACLLDGATLAAHNPHFDAAFIAAFLKANGQVLTCDYHYRDIGSLVTGWLAGQARPLVLPPKFHHLAEATGIRPARYETHTALGDARMTRDVHDVVIGRHR